MKNKNIHVLPTDKPSRLIIYSTLLNEFRLLDEPIEDWKHKRHIYITSDDKFVKDEYITDGIEVIKSTPKLVDAQGLVNRRDWKKIILTTDQDLIKDGVQAIDDEFLEWLIKNPQCKLIESCYNSLSKKCICPKEKLKQHSFCETPEEKCAMNYCDENGCMNRKRILVEPKQETLEEADEKWLNKEFIPSEQALGLTELGFDEPCFGYWSNWAVQEPFLLTCELGKEIESASINRKNILFKAPTFSQAFRFFREKYGIPFEIECDNDYGLGYVRGYIPKVALSNKSKTEPIYNSGDCFNTYEEAELECLKKLIDIVKNK